MKVIIEVLASDADRCKQNDPSHCIVAYAIKKHLKPGFMPTCGSRYQSFGIRKSEHSKCKDLWETRDIPNHIYDTIEFFDTMGYIATNKKFEMDIPEEYLK